MAIISTVDVNLSSAKIEISDVDAAYSINCVLDDEKNQLTVKWNKPKFTLAALLERLSSMPFYGKATVKEMDSTYVMHLNDIEHGSMVGVMTGLISEGCLPDEALCSDLLSTEKTFNERKEDREASSHCYRKF